MLPLFQNLDSRMYVTLEEARKHLQLDDYFREDDSLLISLIRAAEDAVAKRISQPLRHVEDPVTGELAPSVKQAILLLVGTFYNQREATTAQNVRATPLAFDFLADLNRKVTIA